MSTAVRSRVFKISAAAIAIGLCLFSQDDVSASIKERRVERLNAQIESVYTTEYQQMMDDAIEEAQEHGVTVYRDIDKSKFIEAVQPMHEAFESKGDAYKSLYEDIQKYAVAEEEEK